MHTMGATATGRRGSARPAARSGDRTWTEIPALAARPGSRPERFASRMAGRHPVAVFLAAVLGGFVLLSVLTIALGLLLTELVLPAAGIGRADERFVEDLVKERSGPLTEASVIGSTIGGAPVLPILAALIAIVCAFMRRWRLAAFGVFALAVESLTYRVSSLAVPRHRPFVDRLESLDVNASYPSGHVAATVAFYGGLVYLLTSRVQDRGVRFLAWAVAVLVPIFVALSRMYRGMHHPIDVAAGLVVGIGAVLVLLFACRAAGVANDLRRRTARS